MFSGCFSVLLKMKISINQFDQYRTKDTSFIVSKKGNWIVLKCNWFYKNVDFIP